MSGITRIRLCCVASSVFLLFPLLFVPVLTSAQELAPRAYWPAPKGTRFLIVGYGHATGDVVTDPSLPLAGVESRINTSVIGYRHTTSIAGRTGTVQLEMPYVDGRTAGLYQGLAADREFSGFGDISLTLDVNLKGAPTMTPERFQAFRRNPKPILAASVKVVAPTGEYEADKLINIGTNRWAIKGKLGYLHPFRERWVLELGAGTWFFEDNDEFLGQVRQQEPITALDLSLVRRFRPGFWASLDANYYLGGRTIVDGYKKADLQRNSRFGFSLAYPFARRHGVKFSFSAGVVTESGGDFEQLILNYVYRLN